MDIKLSLLLPLKGKRVAKVEFISTLRDLRKTVGLSQKRSAKFGAHGARETPVPIPNTEVKPRSGYYTAFSWENSTVPSYKK